MTITIPSALEDALRRISQEQGRSVEDVVAGFLSRVLRETGHSDGHGSRGQQDRSLKGTVLRYDDPFEPAVPDSNWEALG